jgi:hypothetical protein
MILADVGEIAALARSQADDHSIKLALSCLRLAELEDDAGWLMLAAHTARLGWRDMVRA